MTATPDLLDNLVEDQTYQLSTGPDGSGGVRWQLMRYQRPGPGLERVAGGDAPLWCQVATRATCELATDFYRDAALGWLRSLGHDTDAMDLVLILPSGVERLRPA